MSAPSSLNKTLFPVEIAHPRLLAPKFIAVGLGDATASGSAQKLQNALMEVLNPLDFAKVMKARAANRAEEAKAAIEPARQAANLKARDARVAALEYCKAEIALAAAKERFELADRILKRAAASNGAIKAATAAKDAGAPDRGFRWLVLTVPEGAPNEGEIGARRVGRVNDAAAAKVAPPTASETLDRIEMPDEVAEKLSEMLWAGAALIVSDHEMSHEATDFARTDFVVLTSGKTSGHRAAPFEG